MDICRRKWKSLRDTYLREKKKEGEKRSGSAAGQGKKWKYSAVLSFLDPFIAPREMSSNMARGVEEDGAAEESLLEDEGQCRDKAAAAGPSSVEFEHQGWLTSMTHSSTLYFLEEKTPCIVLFNFRV